MKKRVMSGAIVFLVMVLMIASRLITPYIFDIVILIAGTVGVLEVVKALSNKGRVVNENMASTFMFVSYVGVIFAIMNKGTLLQLLLYFGCMLVAYFLISLVLALSFKDVTKTEMIRSNYIGSYKKYVISKAFRSVFVMIYPALLFVVLILLNHIEAFFVSPTVAGDEKVKLLETIAIFVDFVVIATFVSATFTDTFAMLIGSKVKGPKLCPKISPNKTISGAVGGLVMGIIGVLGIYMLYSLDAGFINIITKLGITWLPIVAMAVLTPIFTQVGDIIASIIKRKSGIKDYGKFIPGHGGIMDRVDGLIFAGLCSFVITLICIF